MVLMSNAFYDALIESGVLGTDPPRVVNKVVIVAASGEPLRVFVEYLGEEGWLDVPGLMAGVEVHTSPPPPGYYELGQDPRTR